jgi:hypothetical protein
MRHRPHRIPGRRLFGNVGVVIAVEYDYTSYSRRGSKGGATGADDNGPFGTALIPLVNLRHRDPTMG